VVKKSSVSQQSTSAHPLALKEPLPIYQQLSFLVDLYFSKNTVTLVQQKPFKLILENILQNSFFWFVASFYYVFPKE